LSGELTTAVLLVQTLYFFVPAYAANMAPVLACHLAPRWSTPIDGGRRWRGKRILGDHKTWRGLVAGVIAAVAAFELQVLAARAGVVTTLTPFDYSDASLSIGLLLGLGTGVGDAVKSFFKRRVDIAPGSSWMGFDQLDFMVGAYVFVLAAYVPPLVPTVAILPIVFVGSIATTATAYWCGMKEAWI
jgi:CDP-2,3-bis-(O-geranylgeranyl)-sn-glycerol synthase